MAANWERYLERWVKAGLIETITADQIRAYETEEDKARGLRWPILVALAFGGLLLAAGILLFVAAHWDRLSPAERFALVLALAAVVHIAGSIAAGRFGILSTTLHAVGTICLGAGIFLTGQIFHLQEHWPGGVMLWALGAWAAWAFLRDWPQAALAAILTPAWLAGEWFEATHGWIGSDTILAAGLLMLTISYLTMLLPEKDTPVRKALSWIGGLALIPAVAVLTQSGTFDHWHKLSLPWSYQLFGWTAAFLLPLTVAWRFRGRCVWSNVIAAFWVAALSMTSLRRRAGHAVSPTSAEDLALYALCALGSVGLIAWGMKEGRKERVNLGIAGFALTVVFFYFSTVMDKLGRSASLIGLGLLFLLGGWILEKTRRRLLARMAKGTV
jgi:uncharacterized membrane protein